MHEPATTAAVRGDSGRIRADAAGGAGSGRHAPPRHRGSSRPARRRRATTPRPGPGTRRLAAVLRNLATPAPAPLPAPAPASPVAVAPRKSVPDGCKTHGTAVHFVTSTVEAVKRAKGTDKLVFVLHLSGNIEDPGFT